MTSRDLVEEFEKRCDEIMSGSDMKFFILEEPDHKLVEVPFIVWARWFGEHKQLALDQGPDWAVSSIFLGFDHSHNNIGLLFETMIAKKGEDRDITRFQTYDECMEFHHESVWLLKHRGGKL